MTYQNLSTIGGTFVLEHDGEKGAEYWKDDAEWTQDLAEATRYGTGHAMRFMTMLQNRGLRVRCKKVPGQYQIMNWVGTGWVVVNYLGEETTVHRIRAVNEGENWFFSADLQRTLLLNPNPDQGDHWQIKITGDEIGKATWVTADGGGDSTAFYIPDNSNMQYLFEFESKPTEYLEVA